MDNVKEIIAKNLAELRKANKLTQSALAEMLNYSDKAISRWEHAETLPDIETLCKICEIYGVSFEYLLQKEQPATGNPYVKGDRRGRKVITCLLAMSTVWLLAVVLFTVLHGALGVYLWQIYIWSIPASLIIAAICNRIWWKSTVWRIILHSLISWTLTLALYLQLLPRNIWLLFIIAVPVQVIIVLSAFYSRKRKATPAHMKRGSKK